MVHGRPSVHGYVQSPVSQRMWGVDGACVVVTVGRGVGCGAALHTWERKLSRGEAVPHVRAIPVLGLRSRSDRWQSAVSRAVGPRPRPPPVLARPSPFCRHSHASPAVRNGIWRRHLLDGAPFTNAVIFHLTFCFYTMKRGTPQKKSARSRTQMFTSPSVPSVQFRAVPQ